MTSMTHTAIRTTANPSKKTLEKPATKEEVSEKATAQEINPVLQFEEARLHVLELIEQNQTVFDQFFTLAEQYNGLLALAKDHVRNIQPEGPTRVGPFRRDTAPQSVDYPAGMLPDSVKLLPGVIKKTDTVAIERYLEDGTIKGKDATAVKKAKTVSIGTAKISGPKEIEVKL